MPRTRQPPATVDLLEALAATFAAGATPAETLALIARAGPASARVARRVSEELPRGSLTAALVRVHVLPRDEAALVAFGEENGRLAAALRWAVERGRISGERRRAILGAAIGPLVFAALGLLSEPLPSMVLGGASFGPAIAPCCCWAWSRRPSWSALPRLWPRWTRPPRVWTTLSRVPLLGALLKLDGEADAAALIAAFADADGLGLAPRAARVEGAQPYVEALAITAADPVTSVPTFSEPFALALQVGLRARDLPTRLAAFHRAAAARLTARLRSLVRVAAFAVLAFVALHGLLKLASSPIPGLGGDLGNLPELKELERELENAGH